MRFFPKRLSLTRRKPTRPDQETSTPVSQKRSKEALSGPHSHGVGPGRSTTPLSTRWTRLGLSGRLWAPTTDRAALAPGSLSFLTGPGVGCSHRMSRLPPLAGNLALLFAAHRSETTASTFRCLHVFLLFLSTEGLGFDSHASQKGLSLLHVSHLREGYSRLFLNTTAWFVTPPSHNDKQDKREQKSRLFQVVTKYVGNEAVWMATLALPRGGCCHHWWK